MNFFLTLLFAGGRYASKKAGYERAGGWGKAARLIYCLVLGAAAALCFYGAQAVYGRGVLGSFLIGVLLYIFAAALFLAVAVNDVAYAVIALGAARRASKQRGEKSSGALPPATGGAGRHLLFAAAQIALLVLTAAACAAMLL